MFFLAGGKWWQIVILVVVAMLFTWIVVQFSPTGGERLSNYLNGLVDPSQASYHVRRALEAFVKGGLFGVGIGKADTKLTGLPVPPTDSIFAVVGEEIGFVGTVGLIGLYVLLLWRGLTIARRAPDELGSLMAAGLVTWISFEAFFNMAAMLNILPFAGNALPFLSAGGSHLVVSMAGIGVLLNISRMSVQDHEQKGRSFSAVIDLRRWDRRRGVSRSRRP
jgi:cell division protein FtsW